MTIVTLRSDTSRLMLAPQAGGAIAAYWQEEDGRRIDWLRPTGAAARARRMPLDMASFPLVPYSGRIRDGRFRFRNREVVLPLNFLPDTCSIHGHGWLMPWTIVAQEEAQATLEYKHAADDWPWPYRATQRFTLTPRRLSLEMALINEGREPMPAGLGPHPYFRRTPQATVTAGVGSVWPHDAEAEKLPSEPVPLPPERDLRRGIRADAVDLDNCFAGWDRRAVIEWPEWRARLVMSAEAPLDFLVVYTPPAQDFFCVEPVSHVPNAVNLAGEGRTDTGLRILEPGETMLVIVHLDTETY